MKRNVRRLGIALALLAGLLATNPAPAALVGWYKLDEGSIDSTTNTTYDAVSANTGTLSPAPGGSGAGTIQWVTTGLGAVPTPGTTAALQFTAKTPTGSSGNPNVTTTLMTQDDSGSGLAGKRPSTIAAWIKPSATQNDANPTIVQMGAASPNGARVTFKLVAGSGGFVTRVEVQGGGLNGTKNVADGNWHHVAVVIPTNATVANAVLYVDGVQEAISSSSGLTTVINVYTNYAVVIGATTGSGLAGDRGFTGFIDDVRIYNTNLTASDIINLYLGPGVAPSVTTLSDRFLVLGSTNSAITFNAGAVGTPPLSITWKTNGTTIPGKTNDSLTLSPATVANVATYTAAVTNAYGGTSKSAILSLNTAPINPPRQAVLTGQAATFSVVMPTDSTGYTYQWRTNGVNIAGATSATLTVNNASAANAGTNYQVVVTLGGNSATSSPAAKLNVLPVPSSAYEQFVLGDVPAGFWRLGENNGATVAVDQTGFYPGAYSGYTGVELSQTGALTNDSNTASQFTGANYMQVPYDAQLTSSNGLTLETWVNPSSIGTVQSLVSCYGNLPIFGYNLFISAAGSPVFRTYSSTSPAAPTINDLTNTITLTPGSWTHIVATYDGTTKSLYVNGVLAGTQTVVYFPATSLGIRFGAGITGVGGIENPLSGFLDEAAIYSKALTAQQIQNHYLIGSIGAGVVPTITTQPSSQRSVLGDTNATATFSVTVSGSPIFHYQWASAAGNLSGKTNSTLVISPVTGTDIGTYHVGITNAGGGVVSSNATLSYTTGPISPSAQAVFNGAPAAFTLTGMPAYQIYTYQWKHAGTNLPGATSATLNIPAAAAAHAGSYTVVATLAANSAESDPATLLLLSPPSQSYSNFVAADLPQGWWRLDDAPGSSSATEVSGLYPGSAYPDATFGTEGALLGDPDTCASFTGYSSGARAGNSRIDVGYSSALNGTVFSVECWAMVTGGGGTDRSAVTSRSTGAGTVAGYALYAASNDQWQFQLGNGTVFTALNGPPVVENQWAHLVGTCDGSTAAFYVNGALVASTAVAYLPNSVNRLSIGAGATETVSGSLFFPGRVDEVAVYGAVLNSSQVAAHYAGAFPTVATPRFTQQPLSRAVLSGGAYTIIAGVHSTPTVAYQWQHNGTNLPGATGTSLAFSPASASQAGTYQLIATHGVNRATNAPATLQVLVGEAVSANLEGFENARTVAANGGIAGYVATTNWNELGYGANSFTTTNLINNKGQSNSMTVTWSSGNNRRWNGPFTVAKGDAAMLNGFFEAVTGTDIILTLSNIPANYQSAGYSLYLYLGEPSATAGIVNPSDTFGGVSVGAATNYYHAIDLAVWDGNFHPATTTDSSDPAPADANYAVFTNLHSASVTADIMAHPFLTGPASLSGFQLVANVSAPTPVALSISQNNGTITLTWPGTWVLQKKAPLDNNPNNWTDVTSTSPYVVPTPLAGQQYYRLRSPQ